MKHLYKLLTIFVTIIVSANSRLYAQNIEAYSEIRSELDHLFENLDKNRIPTGYLLENAIDYIDLTPYSGQLSDTNYVDLPIFESILKTLQSSSVRSNTSLSGVDINGTIHNMLEDNEDEVVHLGIIAYKYNYVKPDALENNLIGYTGDQVYDRFDVNGNWLNPYDESYAVAFAPSKHICKGESITFDFDDYLFTNLSISTIELDYGNGYTLVTGSNSFSIPEGLIELAIKITLNDGKVLYSHSTINAIRSKMELFGDGISGPIPFNDSSPYLGFPANAMVTIDYIDGNTTLTKPLIVVEGFDPVKLAELLGEDEEHGFCDISSFKSSLSSSLKDNYDIVYVDWLNSESYIQGNANRLIEIIEWVNSNKVTNEKNVLYAHSMGGLIARYALCKMEQQSISHEVSTFISHDSPHLGVNLPIGFQYALYDIFSNFKLKSLIDFDFILTYLHSPSAKQMLLHYVAENGELDNSLHNSWLTELRSIGFPKGDNLYSPIRNIAISNGGVYTKGDILAQFTDGFTLDRYGFILSLLLGFSERYLPDALQNIPIIPFIFKGDVNCNANITILPFNSSACKVYDAKVSLTKHINAFNWEYTYHTHNVVKYAPTGIPMDNVNGSYYSLPDLPEGFLDSFSYVHRFMFVPTVSSLCVGSHNINLSYNDYQQTYTNASNTPFDDVYTTSYSTSHQMSLSSDMCNWIEDNLVASLNGPICAVSGSAYEMHNVSEPIVWSTSDTDIATISSTGVLNVKSAGYVTVYADVNYGSHTSHFEKRVMTGLPTFTLTADRKLENVSYSVTARCPMGELSDFWSATGFKYQWGVKEGTGSIVWSNPSSTGLIFNNWDDTINIIYPVDASTSSKMVYFKISNDVYSATYSISCPMLPIASPIDPPIIIMSDGTLQLPGNEVSIEVKSSDVNTYRYIFKVADIAEMTFDYIPSQEVFIKELLKISDFKKILYDMKPWGEDTLKLIDVQMSIINDTGETVNSGQVLKLIYQEN